MRVSYTAAVRIITPPLGTPTLHLNSKYLWIIGKIICVNMLLSWYHSLVATSASYFLFLKIQAPWALHPKLLVNCELADLALDTEVRQHLSHLPQGLRVHRAGGPLQGVDDGPTNFSDAGSLPRNMKGSNTYCVPSWCHHQVWYFTCFSSLNANISPVKRIKRGAGMGWGGEVPVWPPNLDSEFWQV